MEGSWEAGNASSLPAEAVGVDMQGRHYQELVGTRQTAFGVGSSPRQMTAGRNTVSLAPRSCYWCCLIPWNRVYWDEVTFFPSL